MTWSIRRSLKKIIPDISEVYDLLYRFGITADRTAFFYTAYAVYLSIRQPDRLLLVTKWLYPDVAKHYSTTWSCVERGIRRAIEIAWKTSPELLEELARHPLEKKPTPAKFLAILAAHFFAPRSA